MAEGTGKWDPEEVAKLPEPPRGCGPNGGCVHKCIWCGGYSHACFWGVTPGLRSEFHGSHGSGRCVPAEGS